METKPLPLSQLRANQDAIIEQGNRKAAAVWKKTRDVEAVAEIKRTYTTAATNAFNRWLRRWVPPP